MADLSPAAFAVMNSVWNAPVNHSRSWGIAAALRAAVEQSTYQDAWDGQFTSAEKILAIAAELEQSL
jgi:hypothetical protein